MFSACCWSLGRGGKRQVEVLEARHQLEQSCLGSHAPVQILVVLLVYVGFETGRNEVASEMGSCRGGCRKMPGGGSLGHGEWGWWRGGAGGQHSAPRLGFQGVLTQGFVFALRAVPV